MTRLITEAVAGVIALAAWGALVWLPDLNEEPAAEAPSQRWEGGP